MHTSSANSTEWETDSDNSEPQSPDDSKPGTPIPRVDTLRSLSGPAAKSRVVQSPTTDPPALQSRPPKPIRASRPPSSLSTRSISSVHPLLGLHPHIATTSTTSSSPQITITSHPIPDPSYNTLYHEEPSPMPLSPYPSSLSRPRTTSTLSSPSSSALSSLAHLPTRPPSPYTPSHPHPHHLPHHTPYSSLSAPTITSNLISFFPPSNPLLSLESIHPLLPAPFLGNHLTVLSKRTPVRESLERVRGAKAKADAAANGGRIR